jgi:hypothetical protein
VRRAFILLLVACESSALGSHEHLPRLRSALEPFGVGVEVAPTHVTTLAWHAPQAECTQVYRIAIDYDPALAHEEASTSWLALGHHADDEETQPDSALPVPPGQTFAGRVHYEGIRVKDPGVSRDVWLSALHAGPASPTAGCLGQTWDPIDDALALGWPELTGRLTAVDETWTGLRVEGKCNKSACVDPLTGRGGADNAKRACVTQNFVETLGGVYELSSRPSGPEMAGEPWALVTTTWTDGHGPADAGNTVGIWSERVALVSVEHGRPAWARAVIHYNFGQQLAEGGWGPVTRTWEMQSVDACPGSLAAMGWTRSPSDVENAEEAAEALASSDELRKRRQVSDRKRATIEQSPEE